MVDRLLRLREVLRLVPYGRSSLYAKIKAGTFPAPVPLGDPSRGDRAVAWSEKEVDAFVAGRIAARSAKHSRNLVD